MQTDKQIRKQCYNMRDYDLHGEARRASSRKYYQENREKILAQKRAKWAMK